MVADVGLNGHVYDDGLLDKTRSQSKRDRDGYDVEMQEGTMHDVALYRSSGCKVPELVSVVLHHQPKWRATCIISKREQPHT